MSFCLHVVSLTIPYPPNYGGAIDIYYKLKALAENNIEIILHCYQYDRGQESQLEKICKQVFYYKRSTGIFKHFSSKPYIVVSRSNRQLFKILNKDNYPILAEGLHCSDVLNYVNPKRVFVRTHNIEHSYYNELSNSTQNLIKKIFFKTESIKLKKYESILQKAAGIFCISDFELPHFKKTNSNSFLLPPFHQYSACLSKEGTGNYILIHGNLSVEENIKSVLLLMNEVIPNIDFRIVIAGMNPDPILKKKISQLSNTELIPNPSHEKMKELISQAQIILLHTHQATGVKLKLVNSLFDGRHCICNDKMIEGTNLKNICHQANNTKEWIDKINELKTKPFTMEEKYNREKQLDALFNNNRNIQTLINQIYKNVNMM
ncbi:glycosyltransferase family protein [Carboxylicivirga linearis]|uniref:Glycosyltransferase n=1 Tax=Carboxylicivirga linearis TaxID=1628157 RepID=A0ABS5K049_9BACT|nr:glycosyltransferase [Carboxylicivirga linearis]MBS2100522.1 glycosyltransferase [Carboxylicivirga linearis]